MPGLNSLIGLGQEKQRARIQISACKISGEPFPHTLISGPGGTGKTQLARAIAHELQYPFIEREAASLKTRKDITHLLSECSVKGRFLLFLDEIHRLTLLLQETLYYPMKEWRITSQNGDIFFPPFCLIGATTRIDMLDENSFVSRFENKWDIESYHPLYIQQILSDIFRSQGISCSLKCLYELSQRCLGNPRRANNLAKKIRDYAYYKGRNHIQDGDIEVVFDLEKIDNRGLSDLHRKYLSILSDGNPKGIGCLAGRLGQNEETVLGSIEPVLLSLGFIDRTRSGRIITETGRRHLCEK